MQSLIPNTKSHPSNQESNSKKAHHHPDSLWERLAYGVVTLIIAIGPVLMGMDSMQWMAIYMGLNVAILSLFACWVFGKVCAEPNPFHAGETNLPNHQRM